MSKASIYFTINNLDSKHDIKKLKKDLDTFNGVISVSMNSKKDKIAVDFDTTGVETEQLKHMIENLGFEITNSKLENHIM